MKEATGDHLSDSSAHGNETSGSVKSAVVGF
jgi:hypothetical protein